MPTIYTSKSGKKYFIINKKRIFLNAKLTNKEVLTIYKLLKQKLRNKKTNNKVTNSAKAVINITNPPSKRRMTTRKNKAVPHGPNIVTVTSGKSNDEDIINSLTNKNQMLSSKLNSIKNIDYSAGG